MSNQTATPQPCPIPAGLAEFALMVASTAPPATPQQQLRIAQICAHPAREPIAAPVTRKSA